MQVQRIFCAACNREVPFAVGDEPLYDGQATLHDPELVCLEIGEHRCATTLCPVCRMSPEAMQSRLVQMGGAGQGLRTMSVRCEGCDRVTESVVLNAEYRYCTECRTVSRWSTALDGERGEPAVWPSMQPE